MLQAPEVGTKLECCIFSSFLLTSIDMGRNFLQYTLQARNQASAPSPVRRVPRAIPRPQTGFGWAVVALLLAALSKAIFGWQLPRWLRGGQGRTKGGRWVQDRSLGGKLVSLVSALLTLQDGLCAYVNQWSLRDWVSDWDND